MKRNFWMATLLIVLLVALFMLASPEPAMAGGGHSTPTPSKTQTKTATVTATSTPTKDDDCDDDHRYGGDREDDCDGHPTKTPTPSKSPTPSKTPTPTKTKTPTPTDDCPPTRTPSKTPTPSQTATVTTTVTVTTTATPSSTPTASNTPTQTGTPNTETATPTEVTQTATSTPTEVTPTDEVTPTLTATPTNTPTQTATPGTETPVPTQVTETPSVPVVKDGGKPEPKVCATCGSVRVEEVGKTETEMVEVHYAAGVCVVDEKNCIRITGQRVYIRLLANEPIKFLVSASPETLDRLNKQIQAENEKNGDMPDLPLIKYEVVKLENGVSQTFIFTQSWVSGLDGKTYQLLDIPEEATGGYLVAYTLDGKLWRADNKNNIFGACSRTVGPWDVSSDGRIYLKFPGGPVDGDYRNFFIEYGFATNDGEARQMVAKLYEQGYLDIK